MVKPSSNPLVDSELAARFALVVIELFQVEASLAQIQAAAKSAFYWADYCQDLLETASPVPQPPACQPGCDSCCHNQVELTAPEALLLGSYLAAKIPAENLQPLLARVETSEAGRAGKTKVQLAALRAELPCPFLKDSRCSVYEVRPLMCRSMHSLEAESCRRELADPNLNLVEFYSHRHIINLSISQGLIDACLAMGYEPGPVDLTLAMRHYFSRSDLAESWLNREAVFHD